MDVKLFATLLLLATCVIGGWAFGAWMDNASAGVFAGAALLVLADK